MKREAIFILIPLLTLVAFLTVFIYLPPGLKSEYSRGIGAVFLTLAAAANTMILIYGGILDISLAGYASARRMRSKNQDFVSKAEDDFRAALSTLIEKSRGGPSLRDQAARTDKTE